MSTIITRNSANSGSVPSSLVQGELAINVTDGRLFYGSGSSNNVKEFGVTASYALNALTASYAISASYEINYETSSSYADYAVSASNALTASYVNPLTQSVNITGSLTVTGSSFVRIPSSSASGIIVSNPFDSNNSSYSLQLQDALGRNNIWMKSYSVGAGAYTGEMYVNNIVNIGFGTYISGNSIKNYYNNILYIQNGGGITNLAGNVAIGSTTITSPSARLHVRGSGATSATTGLRVENANASASLIVNDAGDVYNNGVGGVTSNTFYGEDVGRSATGAINSFFGFRTGRANTTGFQNSFFGSETGRSNTSGYYNSFFGYGAGYLNTTGNINSFFGWNSGYSNTTGVQNVFFGAQAGQYNTTGNNNIFLGVASGRLISVGTNLTIANNSVFLGTDTRPNADSETNQIVIGHNAIGLGSNTTVIGNTSTTLFRPYGNVAIGKNSANSTLDVSGSAIITGSLTVTEGITGSFSGSVTAPGSDTQIAYNNNGTLFATSSFVYSGSRVGIGIGTPTTTLDVNGTTRITGLTTISNDSSLQFSTSIAPNSLVGIGFVTSGGTERATFKINWSTGEIRIGGTGGGGYYPTFYSNGIEAMRLTSNRELAIGTITALSRLHVRGSGATSATTALRVENTNASASLIVNDAGNVAIGKDTANATLDVSGSAIISGSVTTTGAIIGSSPFEIYSQFANRGRITLWSTNTSPSSPQVQLLTNGTARMTIVRDGNIGIGTSTPSASLDVAGTTRISGSFNTATSGSILTVIGSGSAQPLFTVQGSQGELFSVTDSLSGSLFSVNDISGLPILEVFSDNTTLMGSYLDPMLITTTKVTQTNSGSFVVYSLPTASYDTAFFEYSIKSGSNARAGTIMAIQDGSTVNFTETTTTDIGDTTAVSFTVLVTGSNIALTGSSTSGAWVTKCIIRGI